MKKKFLMLLMAGVSFVILPSCGDDEDDNTNQTPTENNDQPQKEDQKEEQKEDPKEEETPTGLQLAAVAGTYKGSIYAANDPTESLQDGLGVVVETGADNTLKLAIEPITMMGIEVNNIAFSDIPATYEAAKDAWNFTAEGLQVSLLGGMINATVDVNEGVFTEGKLNFTINVKTDQGVDVDLNYIGAK